MQLSANNFITPVKAAEDKAKVFTDKAWPFLLVGLIGYVIFKGGRYGA
jgi:hypothetical protein